MTLFHRFDGSGRKPRLQQDQALNWLSENWNKHKAFVVAAPTGCGKSGIIKSIQEATSTNIITPNNLLVHQYEETYPSTNILIGSVHYPKDPITDTRPEYEKAKALAIKGTNTIFNTHSFYWATKNALFAKRNVTAIDEFQQLVAALKDMGVTFLFQRDYDFPDDLLNNELDITSWMTERVAHWTGLIEELSVLDTKRIVNQRKIDKFKRILKGYQYDPDKYTLTVEIVGVEKALVQRPVEIPFWVRNTFSRASDKVVLASATAFKSDVKELLGHDRYAHIDLPAAIPVSQRPIFFRPLPFGLSFNDNPDYAAIAAALEEYLDKYPELNTVVHTTYADSAKIAPFMKRHPILTHTKENKSAILQTFLEEGKKKRQVLFACGMAEGIDLKGDLCRLNIILKLQYPNLNDPYVKKRLAAFGGQRWYEETTLKTVIQQAGRSTRSEDDWSYTIILDNRFAGLIQRNRRNTPQSFLDAIIWSYKK